jgi:valyl-tRNA synthetase
MRMLHPFMPFLTEEIWQKIPHKGVSIMVQEFPTPRKIRENPKAAKMMESLMGLIGAIRSLRAELNVEPQKSLDAVLVIPHMADRSLIRNNISKLRIMARLDGIQFSDYLSKSLLKGVCSVGEFGLDIQDAIDLDSERERLKKEIGRVKAEIDKVWKNMNNGEFLSRAPEEVVSKNKERYSGLLNKLKKLESNLNNLPVT